MAILDANGGKAGSLVAAAMETAGMAIQADVLTWVQDQGMILAGLLYLIGIIAALFVVASGGQYIWGRYLLVGPALFLFLTQTTDPANGAQWQFADRTFDDAHVERALSEANYTGEAQVALFFKFWNNFISTSTQELMGLLNLTQDGSHLDFLTKLERYMNFWFSETISDANLERFIRLVMVNQCADYYMMQTAMADPHVDQVEKSNLAAKLQERRENTVFTVNQHAPEIGTPMEKWLVENEVLKAGASYNCKQIWEKAVKALQDITQEDIETQLSTNLSIDQERAETTAKFLKKIGTQTSAASEQVLLEEGRALEALNWVIARKLWLQITNVNKVSAGYDMEGHGAFFASMAPNGAFPLNNSGTQTNSVISQFNRVNTYQFKGDFVNAAMALPHFQGVALLLLAAGYPFFAMAMVVPGRAGAILTWMGLWAWIKLWDVGFAVVMMIDNLLYTMFPRGPGIGAGDINQPGRAFVSLMEQDPSYNSAAYYNIIAICLYAVPIVCGVFVKGSGSMFIGIVRDAWQAHSSRLAGSAGSFAAALQGQSYVADQRRKEAELSNQALKDSENDPQIQDDMQDIVALSMQLGILKGTAEMPDDFSQAMKDRGRNLLSSVSGYATDATGKLSKDQQAKAEAFIQRKRNAVLTAVTARAQLAEYNHSAGPGGWWAAESAVAAKYYTHDTHTSYPGGAVFSAALAREYVNNEKITGANIDNTVEAVGNSVNRAMSSMLFPQGGAR